MQKLSTIQKRENLNAVYKDGAPGPGGAYHDYAVFRSGPLDGESEPRWCCSRRGAAKNLALVRVFWMPTCWKLFETVCAISRRGSSLAGKTPAHLPISKRL